MTLFREFLGHTRMSRLPVVAVAHWFTMVSFGVLFFTLLNAFGQLFDPHFALPLIGHFPPYEWVTELFAWRRAARHRRADGDPAAAAPAPPAGAVGARGSSGRRSGRPTTSS